MSVPFGDLRREWVERGTEIRSEIERVPESAWFVLGKELWRFEHAFAAYLGDAMVLELQMRSAGSVSYAY